ncbi:uncharacterized protein LOC134749324 [Cydia strobilella]|uniref:uncharacterized protein LOC134749324 n=1 Tax=Cydia strobilella TaxID=1100964 RepID=UPI0030046E11
MVKYLLFLDPLREEEINNFYKACQMHRNYYRGYPKAYHPLSYFSDGEYAYQCPPEMSHVYLSYPSYHVKYKQPAVLNITPGRTSGFPPLPGRSLAPRYNKPPYNRRQDEVELFYEACQRHRNYYRGYPKAYHPLSYFLDAGYMWQCPPDLTPTYLSFPTFHVKYKQPAVLPGSTGRTSGMPDLPGRTLAGRYNKAACKAFIR